MHQHLADLNTQSLMCACRPCALLFTDKGAGGGRYRTVPERVLFSPNLDLSPVQWDGLAIPVELCFVFDSTPAERHVAFYPGPAGATESLLSLESWADVVEANPMLGEAERDVEAVLLRRVAGRVEGYVVPIDECYHLVGLVRQFWRGFDGGSEVWEAVESFLGSLAARAAVRR